MFAFPSKRFALDFYVPFPIEWTALSKRILEPAQRRLWLRAKRHYINAQLTLADFIYCANERQRDSLVGHLSMLGLVPPSVYNRDATLRRFIDVVPYGVQGGKPSSERSVMKGVVPGIRASDTVLIWNGSIMEWLDARTVIQAMKIVREQRDDVKLFFLGVEHPDYVTGLLFDPPKQAVQLSKELGLFDNTVFFNLDWVPYDRIGAYLAEADIGVCAALDGLEQRFSSRTRIVDLFWAELPVVCTKGDLFSERIANEPLGAAVEPHDPEAFATAILRLVEDEAFSQHCRTNIPRIKAELSWDRVLDPLVAFCSDAGSIAAPKPKRIAPLLRRNALEALALTQRVPWFVSHRLLNRGHPQVA
jgi:glycosyltransferase involved in cell wall biosynthesis